MSTWKDQLWNKLEQIETRFDQLKLDIGTRNKSIGELQVIPYRGYCNGKRLYCRGRVLESPEIVPNLQDGKWQNFVNVYKRFESDEIPNAHVRISYDEHTFELTTDEEGYYILNIELPTPSLHKTLWQPLKIELLDAPVPFDGTIVTTGEILTPIPDTQIGIISDMDDTVIKTDVVSKSRMLYHTFFHNAYSRLAFKGVAAFYWALRKGMDGEQNNPVFYVSNSPWNLYDLLEDFLDHNDIPKGPIFLRDFGMHKNEQAIKYKTHKHNEVLRILLSYPNLKFILIGDSGEKDLNIYLEVARAFPNRIAAIYIRKVEDRKRNDRIAALAEKEEEVPVFLFDNSFDAAKHAAKHRFISPGWLVKVKHSMDESVSLMDDWFDED